MTERRYITFRAGEHSFGVPIEKVWEVVASSSIFPVPGGRKPLLGIIPYREKRVLPVFSLLEILGGQEVQAGDLIVIAGPGEAPVGFTVRELGGIITASGSADEVEPYQGELEGPSGMITGLLKKPEGDYILLEIGGDLSI